MILFPIHIVQSVVNGPILAPIVEDIVIYVGATIFLTREIFGDHVCLEMRLSVRLRMSVLRIAFRFRLDTDLTLRRCCRRDILPFKPAQSPVFGRRVFHRYVTVRNVCRITGIFHRTTAIGKTCAVIFCIARL